MDANGREFSPWERRLVRLWRDRLTGFNKVPQASLLALSPQAGSEITLALLQSPIVPASAGLAL